MIMLRTPRGWTGPKRGGRQEGRGHLAVRIRCRLSGRTHQPRTTMAQLETWLRSYRPEELFDEHGVLRPELRALAPTGRAPDEREPAVANGGLLLRDLDLPDFTDYAVAVDSPAAPTAEATRVLGRHSFAT